MMKNRAFTLIELLIVVAIIAILAAIAVPNFLEAQVRAKCSRAHSDMRSIALALESYKIDSGKYCPQKSPNPPYGMIQTVVQRLTMLSTPIAYLSSIPVDPWEHKDLVKTGTYKAYVYAYKPDSVALKASTLDSPIWGGPASTYMWLLEGYGPMQLGGATASTPSMWFNGHNAYDPTNGTVSGGHIIRRGP